MRERREFHSVVAVERFIYCRRFFVVVVVSCNVLVVAIGGVVRSRVSSLRLVLVHFRFGDCFSFCLSHRSSDVVAVGWSFGLQQWLSIQVHDGWMSGAELMIYYKRFC